MIDAILESLLCSSGSIIIGNKIVSSIDFAQQKAKKKMPPFIHSSQTPIQTEKYVNKSRGLLEELGVNSQQFKNLSENLPLGLALYKIIYDKENAPVDFVTLEVNPAYEKDLGFKREQIVSKNVLEVYPEIKVGPIDWIDPLGRVGRTGVSECFETIFSQNNNCYQVYACCPRKGFSL